MGLQLVSFEQAQSLKELGFPQENGHEWELGYNKNGRVCPYGVENYGGILECYAPTLELVAKWLREDKNIEVLEFIHLEPSIESNKRWCYRVETIMYKDFEEALSAGIDKAINKLLN